MIWPLWPGCAFLVAVLLLTPRKIWPAVLLAGVAGFAVYDVQEALPIRTTVHLLVADSIEILVAALGVSYVFGGVPHLSSVKALVKYALFAVILAPVAVASAAARAIEGDSWWVGYFTEALALLTLTPAILGWVDIALNPVRKPKAQYIEATLLWLGLATFAYFTFVASSSQSRAAMLYSLVPFLLWAALRFGITGASSSIVLVAFLAILGAVHRRGPFTGSTPVNDVLSLQLFLLVAGSSFMVLAAVVEEHKTAEQSVRESENRLRLAQQVARIGAFERDVVTGVVTWTPQMEALYGLPPGGFGHTRTAFENLIHPDDRAEVVKLVDEALKTGQPTTGDWRVVWPDGSVHWIAGRWQTLMNDSGEPARVVGVNMDITDRRRAEESVLEMNRVLHGQKALLQSREELLKIFVKNVPVAVAMLDRDMCYLQVSDRWRTDYLRGRAQILGRSHHEIFPDMPERWKEVHRRGLQGETLRADEDHWDGEDGPHWARWEVRPWNTPEGAVGGILIFAEDITHRKQMEDALAEISRKLIQSQEQERTRIGRELHDDINQRLAMLALELQQLQDDPSEVSIRLQELRRQTNEISNDVQALSHELHSSKLEYLGVVSGIRSWCKEFAERQGMEINLKIDVRSPIPLEIGVTLFRILQEALHNAVKYSGVKRIDVQLSERSNDVQLMIVDAGKGFDVEAARRGRGLGLASMEERARLVKGTVSVESRPMSGTTIYVRVPLDLGEVPERKAV
jgi:PAS domain S-box-containing protein